MGLEGTIWCVEGRHNQGRACSACDDDEAESILTGDCAPGCEAALDLRDGKVGPVSFLVIRGL